MSECLDNNTFWDDELDVWYDADEYNDTPNTEEQNPFTGSTTDYESYSAEDYIEDNDPGCVW